MALRIKSYPLSTQGASKETSGSFGRYICIFCLTTQGASKRRPWSPFLRQRESLFSGQPNFSVIACRISSVNLLISFTFPLPSPYLLRISFTISFNLSAYLSDCYLVLKEMRRFFGKTNISEIKERSAHIDRWGGWVGWVGTFLILHAHARRNFYFRCKIVHVRAHRNFRKIAAPSAPSDPIRQVVRHHMSSLRMDCTDIHIAAWPVDLFELCAFPQLLASIS